MKSAYTLTVPATGLQTPHKRATPNGAVVRASDSAAPPVQTVPTAEGPSAKTIQFLATGVGMALSNAAIATYDGMRASHLPWGRVARRGGMGFVAGISASLLGGVVGNWLNQQPWASRLQFPHQQAARGQDASTETRSPASAPDNTPSSHHRLRGMLSGANHWASHRIGHPGGAQGPIETPPQQNV